MINVVFIFDVEIVGWVEVIVVVFVVLFDIGVL